MSDLPAFATRLRVVLRRCAPSRPASRLGLAEGLLAAGLLAAVSGTASSAFAEDRDGDRGKPPVAWTKPVPRAECGPGDRTETGLQGQTTLAERQSGASLRPYNCNLERVGQFAGEGAEWQLAWYGSCAYYDTKNSPAQKHPGTAVIDVSNPKHPVATDYLDDPSLAEPWESLKVNERRGLLGGVQANNAYGVQPGFSLYDVASNCRHPRLLASVDLPSSNPAAPIKGHAGAFSPDGRTYWGTTLPNTTTGNIYAIDIASPEKPKLIVEWVPDKSVGGFPHDVSISPDGNRIYIAQPGDNGIPYVNESNGLVIADVSGIQRREPGAVPKVVGSLFWGDSGVAQEGKYIRIRGKPFVLFSDEAPIDGTGLSGAQAACAQGLPPSSFARLIDISDETHPVTAAKLMLEVHDPKNCAAVLPDSTDPVFFYSSHYCTVDDPNDASLAACSYFQAGIRIFYIRDPYHPQEIAYYKPGAVGAAARPGSAFAAFVPGYHDHDWSSSNIRLTRRGRDIEVWFTSHDNGFQVLRLSEQLTRELDFAYARGRIEEYARDIFQPDRER